MIIIEYNRVIIGGSHNRELFSGSLQLKEEMMKKLVFLAVLSVFALSLSGCANKASKDPIRVKCPSCGFEFEVPTGGIGGQ